MISENSQDFMMIKNGWLKTIVLLACCFTATLNQLKNSFCEQKKQGKDSQAKNDFFITDIPFWKDQRQAFFANFEMTNDLYNYFKL